MSARKYTAAVRGPKPVQSVIPGAGVDEAAAPVRWAGMKGSKKGLVQRAKAESDRIIAYLPRELGQALRRYCADEREEISSSVTAAVRQWLAAGAGALPEALLERVREVAKSKGLTEGDALRQAVEQWCARADRAKR